MLTRFLAIAVLLLASVADAQIKPIVPDSWTGPHWYVKEPSVWYPVWIDPAYESQKDSTGVSLGKRIREMFVNVGCISSVGFYEGVPPGQCRWRFHYRDGAVIEQYSKQWKQYASGLGSIYFAVHPNRADIYTGGRLKAVFGGGPLSPINAIRIPGHAWMYALGWPEQGPGSPMCAMRNPNMSGVINWKSERFSVDGKAGFDPVEIGWFQAWGRKYSGDGSCWVWREN